MSLINEININMFLIVPILNWKEKHDNRNLNNHCFSVLKDEFRESSKPIQFFSSFCAKACMHQFVDSFIHSYFQLN